MEREDLANRTLTSANNEGFCGFRVTPSDDTVHIARRFGTPLRFAKSVDLLVPLSVNDARPQSMSAVIGLGPQPAHTDCAYLAEPPRWVLLRSRHKDPTGTPTLVWSLQTLLHKLVTTGFGRGLWLLDTGKRRYYVTILSRLGNSQYRLRYDPCCMSPLTPDAVREAQILLDYFEQTAPTRFYWQPDACLLIDNFTSAHARGAVTGQVGLRCQRSLERCYFS